MAWDKQGSLINTVFTSLRFSKYLMGPNNYIMHVTLLKISQKPAMHINLCDYSKKIM